MKFKDLYGNDLRNKYDYSLDINDWIILNIFLLWSRFIKIDGFGNIVDCNIDFYIELSMFMFNYIFYLMLLILLLIIDIGIIKLISFLCYYYTNLGIG